MPGFLGKHAEPISFPGLCRPLRAISVSVINGILSIIMAIPPDAEPCLSAALPGEMFTSDGTSLFAFLHHKRSAPDCLISRGEQETAPVFNVLLITRESWGAPRQPPAPAPFLSCVLSECVFSALGCGSPVTHSLLYTAWPGPLLRACVGRAGPGRGPSPQQVPGTHVFWSQPAFRRSQSLSECLLRRRLGGSKIILGLMKAGLLLQCRALGRPGAAGRVCFSGLLPVCIQM